MHMMDNVSIIVQQYGIPEILPLLSRVDVVPRDLQYNTSAPTIARNVPYVTLAVRPSPTSSGPHR